MDRADAALLLGRVAIVCTVASNFVGLPVCLSMVRKKSTAGISCLPFLAAAVCTSLWLQYGVLVGDGMVMFVNAIAVFLQCCYLGCFHYVTEQKSATRAKLALSAVLMLTAHVYSFHVIDRQTAVQTLGLLSCISTICVCAAPLANIGEVIRNRSTYTATLPIIFASFVVSSLWFLYGSLIGDTFVQVPNLVGAILSALQLSLLPIFSPKKSD